MAERETFDLGAAEPEAFCRLASSSALNSVALRSTCDAAAGLVSRASKHTNHKHRPD